MATMIKEKRKEKKKTKDSSKSRVVREQSPMPPLSEEKCDEKLTTSTSMEFSKLVLKDNQIYSDMVKTSAEEALKPSVESNLESNTNLENNISKQDVICVQSNELNNSMTPEKLDIADISHTESKSADDSYEILDKSNVSQISSTSMEHNYAELSGQLERIAIPDHVKESSQEKEFEVLSPSGVLKTQYLNIESPVVIEDVQPSAPCFEEIPQSSPYQNVILESKPKVKCMRIEDVIRLFSGGEMEEVRSMSAKEEEIVEAGPVSGPEHPLVDLLSTFRSSLLAVERERVTLANNFANEEKSRQSLWKIEKRQVNQVEKCPCGASVSLKATYEHAQFAKEKLPVAKMRLEGLLRDIQDSYCHHQHIALLAYYQIEELISETIKSNKPAIREALSLVLGALRLSASALDALTSALQRWAVVLASSLIDHRDLRQLLFILHHLFKQSRSVRWASRVIQLRADVESPARILAVLELLLAKQRVEAAQECIEDADEVWEEVDKRGDGGAVSEGSLRERDLLSLLHALPIRDLVARILLFTHNDIKQARPYEWVDSNGGRGVLRACYGVRALLQVLRRATNTHVGYGRLRYALRDIAATALHGLAYLHLSNCSQYIGIELREKIYAELEASFFEGLQMFGSQDIHRLPATLLADDTARHYCLTHIEQLHENGEISCKERVCIVSQAAQDREFDHELARMVLEFLLQTALKRKTTQCAGGCEEAARECVPLLLTSHRYLHTIALHILADMNMVETLEPTCLRHVHVHSWRPNTGEVRAVLDDFAHRCPLLLQHLLLLIDCTPHSGLPLDVQLTIGTWLCSYVHSTFEQAGPNSPTQERWWAALRSLRPHRAWWGRGSDAPPLDGEPGDLFATAYALVASSWGHCIPVICADGVSALSKLASHRPRDAVHCLAGVMLVMAQSPESLALTPKFSEVMSRLLSWQPSLVARTLGRGGASGPDLLLRLMLAQLENQPSAAGGLLSAWLHLLWRLCLPATALALADCGACTVRLWPQIGAYCDSLLQEENANEHINNTVANAHCAPLLCECLLRACHTQHETLVHFGYGRLLNALQQQRTAGQRIHVDNALQKVAANISSEELVIYRAATAVLAAPMGHPSHLTLWRLLLHLYLQRAPDYMSSPPVGPLFFSGLKKSRTLSHIKKHLQKTITYHHNEAETLKANTSIESNQAQSTKSNKSSPSLVDDNLLPALTIVDLAGESSGSSDLDDSGDETVSSAEESCSTSTETKRSIVNLMSYHTAAEKMLSEYLCWLEEGDKVRALPQHADIARYIPELALEEAWKRSVTRPVPSKYLDSFPLPTPQPEPTVISPDTPFHRAVANICKIKDRSRRRRRLNEISSPVEDVDFRDARGLATLVDKHLKDMEALALEWCNEVHHISSLDAQLWELVATLRVARPVPNVRKQCANKCAPIVFTIPVQEWCISVDAHRGTKENRNSAKARIRRLARARPHAARTAAALHTIARRTRTREAGMRVVERAWQCAGDARCGQCAPVRSVLTALVADLCERWICDNGATATQLLKSWGSRSSTALQQSLCGALMSPRRLAPTDWPTVYIALLDAQLPAHTLFSYLSKFEMSRWTESADLSQRQEVLKALTRSVQRYGPKPAQEHQMLVELLGVHVSTVMTSHLLCAHVKECMAASLVNKLPQSYWTHVIRAIDAKAAEVPFDQLGHLLRELGVMFWETCSTIKRPGTAPHLVAYAPYVARVLHALQRAFVAVAVGLSYGPERVAWYSWATLQESWSAWVSPHSGSLPLLAGQGEHYTCTLRHFVDSVHQVTLDCPGTEVYLLQHIFEWCIQTYMVVQPSGSVTSIPGVTGVLSVTQESRVQASVFLAELAKLPWKEHQWFYGRSLEVAVRMSTSTDRELTSWCSEAWSATTADTLLLHAGEQLVPRLASLLYLLTGTNLPHTPQFLESACSLPWHRLPERALDEALENFYRTHHNVAQPYHDLPQFRIILLACELAIPPGVTCLQATEESKHQRALGVSQWVRAATSPALHSHVAAHTMYLLKTIARLEAPLIQSEGELEELLRRAVVIMCIEPAASSALPVWVKWVSETTPRLVLSCVSASATLTSFEHFTALSDEATRTAVSSTQGAIQWSAVASCWQQSPWREPSALVACSRLYAAYACVIAHERTPEQILATLQALLAADIQFKDNEPIVAVWICYTSRRALMLATDTVALAGRSLLARWAEPDKRSLLSRVLQAASDQPSPRHRALCRYAQWLLNPDDTSRRLFEAAITSALGSNSELAAWTSTPQSSKLVTLAKRLYPKHDNYFQYELQLL